MGVRAGPGGVGERSEAESESLSRVVRDYRPFRQGCGATLAGDRWSNAAGGGPGLSRGTLANEGRPCAALRQRARSTARRHLAAGREAGGLDAVVGD